MWELYLRWYLLFINVRVGQFWVEGAESMADPWRDPYFFIRLPLARPHRVIIICPKHNDIVIFLLLLTISITIRSLVPKAMKTLDDIVILLCFVFDSFHCDENFSNQSNGYP